ncbi:MAG: GspH/FimT family pseudopilin, partial [Candidatus Binatia bacterium]
GLTVLELIVGLGVIAVVATIGAPSVGRLREAATLRGVPQELYGELQRTRSAAVMENNRYHFTLLDDAKRYRIHDNDDNDNPAVIDDGERTVVKDIQAYGPGTTITYTGAISFFPNGASSGGTITITTSEDNSRTIQVSSGGRIRIQ